MTRITIDPSFSNQLRGLTQPVELCDTSGQVLGRYIPEADERGPQITEEELRRRKQRGGSGRSLAEIMADLEKRA